MVDIIDRYRIQSWLFGEAHGKFDIDFAEAGISSQSLGRVSPDSDWLLSYGIDCGQSELRDLVLSLYDATDQGICITNGSQEGLYILYRILLSSGDHVIVTKPGWQQSWSVPESIGCEISSVVMDPEEKELLTFHNVVSAVRNTTRLISINTPNNPTGRCISRETMQAIGEFCDSRNIALIVDEEFSLDFTSSVVNQYKNAFSASSLSKIYGMPGLRIGWVIGNSDIIEKVINYKRYISISSSSLCEKLAINAIKEHENHVSRYMDQLDVSAKWLSDKSVNFRNWGKMITPEATPFAYFKYNFSIDSMTVARELLAQEKVLLMPGAVFGDENSLRITYARPREILEDGFIRMERAFQRIFSV